MFKMAIKLSTIAVTLITLVACGTTGHTTASAAQPERKIVTSAPKPASDGDFSTALAGQWSITQVGTTVINEDENEPYIIFNPKEHRFYASNGCNILNGTYKTEAGGYMTFSNVLSTMKLCPDAKFERDINEVLGEGRTVKGTFRTIGNESYLYLTTAGLHPLMTLRRADMDYLNGQWLVTEINGTPIDDEEANIFFDVAEGKIHGNTGCNYFNGVITFDPTVPNSINFSEMGVTRMACPKGDQERDMLVGLESTTTVTRGKSNTITLHDAAGKRLLTLKRIDANAK